MANSEFIGAHYRRLVNDGEYRRRMLADPKTELCKEYGYTPNAEFEVEVTEEAPDTVVLLLPPPPPEGADFEEHLAEVTQRNSDILFSSGVGGFVIPDDRLKWILRDLRTSWMAKEGKPLQPRCSEV